MNIYIQLIFILCLIHCSIVKACEPNENPIAPLRRGCEKICPTSPRGLRISICYRIQERPCVCAIEFCRNRRGQCAKNF